METLPLLIGAEELSRAVPVSSGSSTGSISLWVGCSTSPVDYHPSQSQRERGNGSGRSGSERSSLA